MIFAVTFGFILGLMKFNPLEDALKFFPTAFGSLDPDASDFEWVVYLFLLLIGFFAINDISTIKEFVDFANGDFDFNTEFAFRNILVSLLFYPLGLLAHLFRERPSS
jgi:hypothetical protein